MGFKATWIGDDILLGIAKLVTKLVRILQPSDLPNRSSGYFYMFTSFATFLLPSSSNWPCLTWPGELC